MTSGNIIGAALRQARNDNDITQQEMADALGISLWTYNRVENGHRKFETIWVYRLPWPVRQAIVRVLANEHQNALSELKAATKIARPGQAAPRRVMITRPGALGAGAAA